MEKPHGIILAGGKGRRMGGVEKALITLGGQSLLRHSLDRLGPQCGQLAISANGDETLYADAKLPVFPDPLPGHLGPLTGVLAGLEWARANGAGCLFTAPVDTPFLPYDIVETLLRGSSDAGFAIAAARQDGELRSHPVVGVWPVELAAEMRAFLEAGERRVGWFCRQHGAAIVDVTPRDGSNPFFNVNTHEDLARAEGMLADLLS